jgi:hypothetical protein
MTAIEQIGGDVLWKQLAAAESQWHAAMAAVNRVLKMA